MDPVTQGVFGALAAQAAAPKTELAKAGVIGALAGMAPDLDILIRSGADPLLFLEYHRHFTHSLIFIPVGGLLCGLVFFGLLSKRWQVSLKQCLLWSILGFATHALLDACTSYGTRLWWPFSAERVAWDYLSVIDGLVTLPMLGLIIFTVKKQNKKFLLASGLWFAVYLSLATLQHHRALNMGVELAMERGHDIERITAKPSFANIEVWKIIYESDGVFYVDAVSPGMSNSRVWPGGVINKLDLERDFPWLNANSQQARDVERFTHFSDGYVGIDPNNPHRIADIRYSQLPNEVRPMWGIELFPNADSDRHVHYYTQRDGGGEAAPKLWQMIVE